MHHNYEVSPITCLAQLLRLLLVMCACCGCCFSCRVWFRTFSFLKQIHSRGLGCRPTTALCKHLFWIVGLLSYTHRIVVSAYIANFGLHRMQLVYGFDLICLRYVPEPQLSCCLVNNQTVWPDPICVCSCLGSGNGWDVVQLLLLILCVHPFHFLLPPALVPRKSSRQINTFRNHWCMKQTSK